MNESRIDFEPGTGRVTNIENVMQLKGGAIKRVDLPVNAVLVQMFRRLDEEGEEYYERVVSLVVVDDDMKEPLREEALRILNV